MCKIAGSSLGEKTPVWAVICGLIRDPEELISKLGRLAIWRRNGHVDGIVFSTWKGEIDNYPDMRRSLSNFDVKIIECMPPTVSLDRTAFHQMTTLQNGLEMCPSGSIVLKLRVDKCWLPELPFDALVERDLPVLAPLPGWPNVFSRKILIHGGLLLQPLFLCDLFFIGMKEDLLKLISFDTRPLVYGQRIFTEQLFFASPFLSVAPILQAYFRVNTQFLHHDISLSTKLQKVILKDEFMLEVLAVYFLILRQYYQVGFLSPRSNDDGLVREKLSGVTYTSFFDFSIKPNIPTMVIHQDNGTLCFIGDGWLDPLLGGELVMDPFGEAFLCAVARMKNFSIQAGISGSLINLYPKAIKFAEKLTIEVPEQMHYRVADLQPDSEGNRLLNH